jgi:hypothetical protein
MSPDDLVIDPACAEWAVLIEQAPRGDLLGRSLAGWRHLTRLELGLDAARPLIATGHQTLLWHPGILAKYLVVDALAAKHGWATANLIVDQHVGAFGDVEFPVRAADGALAVRTIRLASVRPDVPMALHKAFDPPGLPRDLGPALPCVGEGLERILGAVRRHRGQSNAALQMAAALADLMQRWAAPQGNFTAGDLMRTTLARAMLRFMANEPQRAIEHYNAAVAAVPEAGIGELMIRDDIVELPIWRIQPDGRRVRAFDVDAQRWLADADDPATTGPGQPPVMAAAAGGANRGGLRLFPRALFMTALIRVGVCDVFVHGTGGARYDRAMEVWIESWLGIRPSPKAVASATLRLPFPGSGERIDLDKARSAARRAWHDPPATREGISAEKVSLLRAVEALPRGSAARRAAYMHMHDAIRRMREAEAPRLHGAEERLSLARRQAAAAPIECRRTWAFPLYPDAMIDELKASAAERVSGWAAPRRSATTAPAPASARGSRVDSQGRGC